MLKFIAPSLLIAGAAINSLTLAAEPASQDLIGVEFGVGYELFEDSRISGANANFGIVLPVGGKFDIVVFHETGKATFKDDSALTQTRGDATLDTNELRFRVTAWNNEAQEVKLLVGIGYFSHHTETNNGNLDQSGHVADIGIDFTVVKAASGPVKGQIAINAVYRFMRANEMTDFGFLSKDIGNYNGVIFGATAGLYY